ncbi:MAG TPA: AzlC family ABC transporter permease [Thermomicrobiales bacterium]|jgi:4-azaleucine resistance transporter AzlC
MLPLWLGVVPFALAFAILARTSGFSTFETEALSILVFAGSAQLAFVGLARDGAGGAAILVAVVLLNLRHVLYGLSLNAHLPPRTRPPRQILAAGMTDESYGLTIRAHLSGRGSDGFFFGANLSLLVGFTIATLIGALVGSRLRAPDRLGLDMVFPLSFLALLLPLLRTRVDLTIALVSGGLALAMSRSPWAAGLPSSPARSPVPVSASCSITGQKPPDTSCPDGKPLPAADRGRRIDHLRYTHRRVRTRRSHGSAGGQALLCLRARCRLRGTRSPRTWSFRP